MLGPSQMRWKEEEWVGLGWVAAAEGRGDGDEDGDGGASFLLSSSSTFVVAGGEQLHKLTHLLSFLPSLFLRFRSTVLPHLPKF